MPPFFCFPAPSEAAILCLIGTKKVRQTGKTCPSEQ
jgi:hypothetical protein